MMLNDPCDHRYVLYALGEGPGNLWEASGLPPQPPGVIAGGVRLVSFSAVLVILHNKCTYCVRSVSQLNVLAQCVSSEFKSVC